MTDQETTEKSDQSATTRDIAEGFDNRDAATEIEAENDDERSASLLPDNETERFTRRWQEIQAGFVDEPRTSVEQADALVADLMQRLAAGFSDERERLEGQWDRGGEISTENLRVVLKRYRSSFDRLLAV